MSYRCEYSGCRRVPASQRRAGLFGALTGGRTYSGYLSCSTACKRRYQCDADRGCVSAGHSDDVLSAAPTSKGACDANCFKYWRCDEGRACVPRYVQTVLTDEQRRQQGLYATEAECKAACNTYLACDCGGKCKPVYSDAAVPDGETTPNPGTWFANTREGRTACAQAQACQDKQCVGTIVGTVFAVLAGLFVLALVVAFVVGLVVYLRSKAQRAQRRSASSYYSSVAADAY